MASNVPVCWSATSNVVWKVPVPGKGWSSPIVADGKIYLTTACEVVEKPGISLRVICLSAVDGKTIWDVEAIRPLPSGLKRGHSKSSLANPTPIIDHDRIYAHFGHLGTACLDLDGKVLWRQQNVKFSYVHGNGGSPVLTGSQLVFNCDGEYEPFVAALEADTGKVLWKTFRQTPSKNKYAFSTPLAVGSGANRQIISAGSGFVGGYGPADGRELWRFRYGEGYSVVPRPVMWGDLLFVSSGFDNARLIAITLNGARGDITSKHAAWHYSRQVPLTSSMIVAGQELYFVSDSGIASCLDAKTGTLHWSMRLGGDFSASPVCAEGRIYFQNETGVGYVVRASPQFELISKNDLGEASSYAVANNRLYIRTANHLWAIEKSSSGQRPEPSN
jgi:outer membrane protein assembly factor BamB